MIADDLAALWHAIEHTPDAPNVEHDSADDIAATVRSLDLAAAALRSRADDYAHTARQLLAPPPETDHRS
jgi:hypothetical protein